MSHSNVTHKCIFASPKAPNYYLDTRLCFRCLGIAPGVQMLKKSIWVPRVHALNVTMQKTDFIIIILETLGPIGTWAEAIPRRSDFVFTTMSLMPPGRRPRELTAMRTCFTWLNFRTPSKAYTYLVSDRHFLRLRRNYNLAIYSKCMMPLGLRIGVLNADLINT